MMRTDIKIQNFVILVSIRAYVYETLCGCQCQCLAIEGFQALEILKDLCFLLDVVEKQKAKEERFKTVPLHSRLALHPPLHLRHGAGVLLQPAGGVAVLAHHLLLVLLLLLHPRLRPAHPPPAVSQRLTLERSCRKCTGQRDQKLVTQMKDCIRLRQQFICKIYSSKF